MELIGKTTINPFLFYSGKISGYFTWIVLLLLMLKINLVNSFAGPIAVYISYVASIAALFFVVLSLINLGRSTRLGLPEESTVLKSTGLYGISRNPMYLGFNLWTIASMVFSMNIWIILPGLYSILIYHKIILSEEKFLEKRFGSDYLNYKNRVRRYL